MNIPEMIAQYEAFAAEVHSVSKTLSFDRNDSQQLCAVSLHGTLLELSHGAVELLKIRHATCTPILLRTMLEAYVDLSNLVNDPDYVKRMGAAWYKQQLRLAKAALECRGDNDNPYLTDLAGNEDLEKAIGKIESELTRLRCEGQGKLTIKERFTQAGEQHRYVSVYAHLCTASHNNLNVLEDRHIEGTANGHQVVYFRPIKACEAQMHIDTMAGLIANSLAFVNQLLDGGPQDLHSVESELHKLRELYSGA
jgi:hypothetical protein